MLNKNKIRKLGLKYADLRKEITKLQKEKELARDIIIDLFAEIGQKKLDFEDISISYSNVESKRFNSKDFKIDNLNLYNKYLKTVSSNRINAILH